MHEHCLYIQRALYEKCQLGLLKNVVFLEYTNNRVVPVVQFALTKLSGMTSTNSTKQLYMYSAMKFLTSSAIRIWEHFSIDTEICKMTSSQYLEKFEKQMTNFKKKLVPSHGGKKISLVYTGKKSLGKEKDDMVMAFLIAIFTYDTIVITSQEAPNLLPNVTEYIQPIIPRMVQGDNMSTILPSSNRIFNINEIGSSIYST